jgi:mannose/fructose/N-acetylgalactosamine-specific phosphotransferase system component IIB
MLLNKKPEEVKKQIEQMDEDTHAIKRIALQLAWYMRGSVSYTDILNMSDKEREAINKLVESNLEITKKTELPFF